MKDEQRESRRLRAGMVLLILILLVVGVGITNLYRSFRQAMLDAQKDQLLNISESVANNIVVYLEGFQEIAENMTKMTGFREAEEAMVAGDASPMDRFLEEAMLGREDEVHELRFESSGGLSTGAGTPGVYILRKHLGSGGSFQDTAILSDDEGAFYFRLSAKTGTGTLYLLVPVRKVYDMTAAYIHMGSDGYVMIKDSTGLILMHPVEAQIGIDVLADRKKLYPEFDYSELEVLIQHQLEGRTGVEIYHSYWWADDPPSSVQKASAYVPAHIADDFLSISAVIDYRDISGPIEAVGSRILMMTILFVAAFILLLILVWFSFTRQQTIARENARLKQINEDLEKLRKQEEMLAQQQRLQLIGTMTSGVAHEFNNLLTPIMGYSSMILAGMSEEDENYGDMQEILGSAEKAKQIIDQITQFSRKNAEKMFEPFHVVPAVEKALIIADAVKPRNITLNSDLKAERDICMGNPVQINQMVVNLCNNAIQAIGDQKGTITVEGEAIQPTRKQNSFFKGKEKQWFYRIAVTDTGCGMDEETVDQIFIPFFTTKKPGEGTGLGLAIVQRLVEAHGGLICVHSKPGEGTTFVIYLPVLEDAAEDAVEPA